MNEDKSSAKQINLNKLPLSKQVKWNGLMFLSGQVGIKDGKLVEGGIKAETIQTLNNIKDIIENSRGTDLDDKRNGISTINGLERILDVTVFLSDIDDYIAMNEAYAEVLSNIEIKPTRTCIGVKALPLNAKIEIKVICAAL